MSLTLLSYDTLPAPFLLTSWHMTPLLEQLLYLQRTDTKALAQRRYNENKEKQTQIWSGFWSDHEPTGVNGAKVIMGGI